MTRVFHLVVRSSGSIVTHRMLNVNDGITIGPSDVIIYQEMVDSDVSSSIPLTVRADGTAS